MSAKMRWSAAAVAVLLAAGSAEAQIAVNPNPGVGAGFGGGVGVLGGGVPGINPVGLAAAAGPYALSTVGGYNPYVAPSASIAARSVSPYGLSTVPGGFGGYPGFIPPFGSFFPGGFAGELFGYGAAMQGFSTTIQAAGQYEKDIQTARIIRQQSVQATLETQRKMLQYDWWYQNQMMQSGARRRDAEMALELDNARKAASDSEINSGAALNTLLRSISANPGPLSRAPSAPLEDAVLKNINLSGGTSSGNVGMLKPGATINFPDVLMSDPLKTNRDDLVTNLKTAVEELKDPAGKVSKTTRDNVKANFDALMKSLNESEADLTPSQSIEARKFMSQLASAIKALNDPKAANHFNNTWNAKGRNVAELVDHMTKEGLRFAPATAGDEAAYRAVYTALRAYEMALATAQR